MKNALKYIFIILGVILLDFLTKSALLIAILNHIPVFGSAWDIVRYPYMMGHITNWFNIVFTWNPGTSFSMFRGLGDSAPWVIIVLTAAIIGLILYYLFRRAAHYERLPLALIAGGAIGNLMDRIRFGAVIDFIDWHIGDWHWPAFNIADVCIVVGVGLYVLQWLLSRHKSLSNKGSK